MEDTVQLNLTQQGNDVRIQILSPQGGQKVASSICCVVDVSGSMDNKSPVYIKKQGQDVGINTISSTLSLVQHSLKTIASSLDESDHFSLVTFGNESQEILNYESMTPMNKEESLKKIEKCTTSGGTNLWAGMEQGLERLRQSQSLGKHLQLIVFTDGEPNINPPKGVLKSVNEFYSQKFDQQKPTIHTFGFSCNLNSKILYEIAKNCQGIYSYIPDSQSIGTVLTNSISNIQATYATNAILVFKPLHKDVNADLSQFLSHFRSYKNNLGEFYIELGSLIYDQSKDLIFTQKESSRLLQDYEVLLKYYKSDPLSPQKQKQFEIIATSIGTAVELEFEREKLRLQVINVLNQPNNIFSDKHKSQVKDMIEMLKSSKYFKDEYIESLYMDMSEQVIKSVSDQDNYYSLGQHYLPSLAMAHTHKLCTNYQDVSVQSYAGTFVDEQRDRISDIFMDMLFPEEKGQPSRRVNDYTQDSMYDNLDQNIICLQENSGVQMDDGSTKLGRDIQNGDIFYCTQTDKYQKVKSIGNLKSLNSLVEALFIEFIEIGGNVETKPRNQQGDFISDKLHNYLIIFYNDETIQLANGTSKIASEIAQGDILFSHKTNSLETVKFTQHYINSTDDYSETHIRIDDSNKKHDKQTIDSIKEEQTNNALCFEGFCYVTMADGSKKLVKDIRKGDLVFCPNTGNSEKVKCVIETHLKSSNLEMVQFRNGLSITPFHPIRIQGKWVFPSQITPPQLINSSTIYSFLLEAGHSISVNETECVTFAHGFQEKEVQHSYFGSEQIVNDLRWMKGYWSGHVKLNDCSIIRDPQTGQVVGLKNNRKWIGYLQQVKHLTQTKLKTNISSKILQFTKKFIRI